MNNQPQAQYSLLAKILHWGFVAIFAYGIIKQIDNIEQLQDAALLRFEIIFATGFIALLAVRFIYMKFTQTSSLPQTTPKAQKFAAKLVHWGMYASLSLIALTGLIIGILYGSGITSGAMLNIVIWFHENSVTASYYLIAVHVLAAIYHRFLNDGVWSAMVPFFKEKAKT